MKSLLFSVAIFLGPFASMAQSIGINESGIAPNKSAQLDINSTSKGLLIPRMSMVQRKAIPNAAARLLVFDLDKSTNAYQGAAYLYHRSGSSRSIIRKLDGASGQYSGRFGNAVSVSGFNYIIGAAGKNNYKGEVSFLNTE